MYKTNAKVVSYKVRQGKDNRTIVPDLQKAYRFSKWSKADTEKLEKLLPKRGCTVEFELHNTWTGVANAYRRTMVDEIMHPHFDTGYNLIDTDDDYCNALRLYIRDRINSIPISYVPKPEVGEHDREEEREEERNKMYQFVLEAKNTQEGKMAVTSDMIKPVNKAAQQIKWSERIDIIYIGAARHITINIFLKWGINRQTATFSHFGPVACRPLGCEVPGQKLRPGELPQMVPSWSVIPEKYFIRFRCEWFDDPHKSCMLGWETLVEKLERTKRYVDEFVDADSKLPHNTDYMTVLQRRDGLARYEFQGETRTLGHLLDWFIFMLDPSVPNVRADDDHAEDNSILVLVNHVDHSLMMQKAVDHALAHIRGIIQQFRKQG